MKNIYLTIVGMLVRMAALWFMGALASHLSPSVYNLVNDTITQLGGMEVVIGGITSTVAVAWLSIYLRLRSRIHFNVALNAPSGATTDDVAMISKAKSIVSVLANPNPIK